MEVKNIWNDQIPEKDGVKLAVNDISFSPDGSRIIAAVGNRVLFYRASDGDLIDSLKGHKDIVNCVSYSFDGTRFSSGGSDNVVVIWKSTGQGLLRFTHNAPIQQVKFNPVALLLVACSEVDFGLWTPEQKQVVKEKVPSPILSACWSSDGSLLAIGMLSGLVSIRNQQGSELLKIERKAPIWCLSFISDAQVSRPTNLPKDNAQGNSTNNLLSQADNLVVASWDKVFSLYKLAPKNAVLQMEKPLAYYPLSLHVVNNPSIKLSYLVMTGSNKQIQVMSKEGIKLAEVIEPINSWIWCADTCADEEMVAYGTHTGAVEYLKVSFTSVHSLYRDRYAYRENLTEVIVHHLTIDKRVRIKCKDMIHNISLYRNKLAVQLHDRVCIYESSSDDTIDIHFRLRKEKIFLAGMSKHVDIKTTKNFLVVASNHIMVAKGKVVELYSIDGIRQKLWMQDSEITFMKVDGGIEGNEGIFVGLADGTVLKLYAGNPFPVEILKRTKPILQIESNVHRNLVATVDTDNQLIVTDINSLESIFTLNNVTSICFNSEVEDLLCLTNSNNSVSVVSALIPVGQRDSKKPQQPEVREQHIQGRVIGFKGLKIYTLTKTGMTGIDVPQGSNIQSALDNNDFSTAYKVACLGATEAEWRNLGMRALRSNVLHIAKYAFARLKETKYLNLIEAIQRESALVTSEPQKEEISRVRNRESSKNATSSTTVSSRSSNTLESKWVAEILAYEGHFQEAAKILIRNGRGKEAIQMFIDLKMWEDAKTFARNLNNLFSISDLTSQQAKWLQDIKDWKGAADLFITMGDFRRAAEIIGENQGKGWEKAMLEVVRNCPIEDRDTLILCGEKLRTLDDISMAVEAYLKASEIAPLMKLYIDRQLWTEAAKLAEDFEGKFDMSVFLSYAEWLVSQDRYEEAMDAFKKCGRLDLSRKVLNELTENAVIESRFKDAGYYYWMLAKEIESEINQINNPTNVNNPNISKAKPDQLASLQSEFEHKADLYYAYSNIHSFTTDPFTSFNHDMLFQVSRFIINSLGISETVPRGISKTGTLYTLAKQAMQLQAYKLARNAYDRLSKLKVSEKKLEEVELDMLIVQAKPVQDNQDLLPVCYRCGTTNPLLNPFTNNFAKGDVCTNCGHPFVRSFINFDILPLVEFVPEPRITDEEAIDLIKQPPNRSSKLVFDRKDKKGNWNEEKYGENVNVLSLGNDQMDADQTFFGDSDGLDLFTQCLNHTLESQKNIYTPVQVDMNTLLAMKRSEVFVCKPSSKNKRATFYKNMLPEIPIAISQPCHRFFHLEDFELSYLSEKKCPYSRLKSVGEYGSI